MRSLLDHQAVIQVPDAGALVPALRELLASPDRAAGLTQAARTALAPHQGAARRTAEQLLGLG
jgi:3-deoxy-D-manno-octulosonic-acid transferase